MSTVASETAQVGADSADAGRPSVWHIGGSDVYFRIPLLLRLRQAGFEVAAAGTSDPAQFEAVDIPFHHYDLKPGLGPLADHRARQQLTELFERHRPTVVHAFDTKPCVLVPLARARVPAVRCVRTVTGMGRLFAEDSRTAALLRVVYRRAQRRVAPITDVTVFQNEDDQRYFREQDLLRGCRHELVRGSGVDVDALHAARPDARACAALRAELGLDDRFVVLMVSRLTATKGVREYLQAATQLASSGATLVLVGPVDEFDADAQRLLAEVEDHPHVRYLGKRSDVPSLLAIADAFALPTYYREGLPRVLLEAAVMGVPLITTSVPGCRDVVPEAKYGMIIEQRSADAIATAVTTLIGDPPLRAELVANARDRVQSAFSLDHVAAQYAEIYRSLSPQSGARARGDAPASER